MIHFLLISLLLKAEYTTQSISKAAQMSGNLVDASPDVASYLPSKMILRPSSAGMEIADMENAFRCPISRDIMQNPVIAADGHTYEQCEIERWLQHKSTSPLTNEVLEHQLLTPNHNLRSQIYDYYTPSVGIECSKIDFNFLILAHKHKASHNFSMLSTWRWTTAYNKALKHLAYNIENESMTPEFLSLDVDILADLIALVEDEPFPDEYAWGGLGLGGQGRPSSKNGFYLQLRPQNNSVHAFVNVAEDNSRGLVLMSDRKRCALFKVEIRAEASQSTKRQKVWAGEYVHVIHSFGRANFITSEEKGSFIHAEPKDGCQVGFKAGMLKLQRQSYTLINFVCGRKSGDGSNLSSNVNATQRLQSRTLLAAHVYFHDIATANTSQRLSKSAADLGSLLALYAAKSFHSLLNDCPECLFSLPCVVVESIISKDCLCTGSPGKEGVLLSFVLDWGMHRAKELLAKICLRTSADVPDRDMDVHDGTRTESGGPGPADMKTGGGDGKPDMQGGDLTDNQDEDNDRNDGNDGLGDDGSGLVKPAQIRFARFVRRISSRCVRRACADRLRRGISETAMTEALEQALSETDRLLRRVRLPFVPLSSLAKLDRQRREFASFLPSYPALKREAVAGQFAAAARRLAAASPLFAASVGAAAKAGAKAGDSEEANLFLDPPAGEEVTVGGKGERATPRLKYEEMPALDLGHIACQL
jgi:hypothetical protein